ncbi:hypothetical protein BW41_03265 [Sphingomonas sp. RIT328]|nr:hypothetical protein BW41_03265 [Sphingomonas sp. RIT328]
MTYDKDYGTSCSYLTKARRVQFFEGPNEPAFAEFMEMSTRCVAILFQPLEMVFKRKDGLIVRKYPDVAVELWNHAVRFGEIKSNQAWFDAPGVRRPLDRMDLALAAAGLEPLMRISGEPFRTEPVLEAQAEAMEARFIPFDLEADVQAVTDVVTATGGCARYGAVLAALGGRRARARDKLYAMLVRRIVGFDLSKRPTADTPVTLPRPVVPYALREVLGRFSGRKP